MIAGIFQQLRRTRQSVEYTITILTFGLQAGILQLFTGMTTVEVTQAGPSQQLRRIHTQQE